MENTVNKMMFEPTTLDDEKLNILIAKLEFKNKYELPNFVIPKTCPSKSGLTKRIKKIGKELFKHCAKLTNITIPDTIEEIAQQAFFYCENLQKIDIPSSVKIIGTASFSDCKKLTTVILQEGLKEIKAYAFANCPNLKNIIIPDSVLKIDDHAFEGIEHIKYNGNAFDNGNHWGAKNYNTEF